jgi:Uma2 family endonuclease
MTSHRTPFEHEERRFTRDELSRMIEAGLFADDPRRIELIHGRLLVVPPEGPLHAFSATCLRDRLIAAYAGRAHVRDAKPLDCGAQEQPEPDLAVVTGAAADYIDRHPRADETLLVVEVSRTTLVRDHEKAGIYARARAPEYWLVDLVARRVELHRDPQADRYALVQLHGEADELPVPGTTTRIRVAELVGL